MVTNDRNALAAIDEPAGNGAVEAEIKTRRIDGKFHAEACDGRVIIVKTSSGEIVSDDEPLVLMRGRDHLMVATLNHYRRLCQLDGCNDYQLGLVDELIAKFVAYAFDPSRMKQPGVTRGAAWNPDAQARTDPDAYAARTDDPIAAAAAEPANAQGSGVEERAHCVDCGRLYGGNEWLDLTLPDDQWELIQSPDREDGILCANCIVRRASRLPHAGAIRAVISIAPQSADRDDALEKAAKDALTVFDEYGTALWPYGSRKVRDNLRSVLAQRAGKVE